jgi:hypothetical protein
MDRFLETYSLPRCNQEEIDNLNRLITSSEIEFVIFFKKFPENKSSGSGDFIGESYEPCKEELIPILLKLFLKIGEDRTLSDSFYEATVSLIPKPDRYYKENTIVGQYL